MVCVSILTIYVVCNRNTTLVSGDYPVAENIIPLKLDKQCYVDKFSNLFRDVYYVPLEETRNSVVSEVSKLEVSNSGDIIVFDSRAGAVFRFDGNGKFLNNIGFRGSGNNEYVLPMDVKYDTFNNKVLVWDNGKSSILTYGLDGEIVSKIQIPWIIATFGILDKDHIVCYMNNDEFIRGDETGTNYKIIRRDGLIENQYGEYGSEMTDFNPACEHTFCFQLGRCLCFPPFSPTLFEVGADSIKPIVSFDLLENAIPREWLSGSNRELWKKLKDSRYVEISSVYETSEYFVLKLVRKQTNMLCVVQKSGNKIVSIYNIAINDLYGKVGNTDLVNVYNNQLYFSVEPMAFEGMRSFVQAMSDAPNFKSFITKNEKKMYSALTNSFGSTGASEYMDSLKSADFKIVPGEREFIEEMSERNNPVIQVCTLK